MSGKNIFTPGQDHYEKLKAKLFDEKEFNTVIIGGEEMSKKQEELEVLVLALTDKSIIYEEREEAYKLLKEKKGKEVVLDAIRKTKSTEKKALLVTACWEINFDLSKEFLFFVDLVCNEEFNVALEALTVIENMESAIDPGDISKARSVISEKIKEEPETIQLLEDLRSFLNNSVA